MSTLAARVAALSPAQRARLAERLGIDAGAHPPAARLVAYVVPRSAPVDAATLRAFLKERLPEHMVPAAFVSLDALPRTPNGKLDTRNLPDPEPAAAAGGFVPPVGATEETLAAIWADVLGGVRVGVHDNFFEIGGDSILSIQVVARAGRAGLRLSPDQLFRHQTIGELARVVGTDPMVPAEQGSVEGPVPLTAIQRWFLEQPLAAPAHWHHVLWLDAPADLDGARLTDALQRLLAHHDALRLRFERDGARWRQWYGPDDARVKVSRVDFGTRSGRDLERAQREAADALAATTDLAEGPPLSALIATRSHAAPRVALVVHHLVIDPLSWHIVVDDLNGLYARPDRALPAKTTSFRAWADAALAHARTEALLGETGFWSGVGGDAGDLPRDADGVFTERSAHTVETALDASETRALLEDVPGVYGTHTDEVLLTALVQTLGEWAGRRPIRIGIERHGREALAAGLDLARTVGWFTSFFPVTLSLDGGVGPGDALRAIKEQLRAVPGRGIGYGLLRYLAPWPDVATRLRAAGEPPIIFNYAGRGSDAAATDVPFRPVGVPVASRDPRNERTHLLEVDAFVRAGSLVVRWTYSADVHRPATVEGLAVRFLDELRTLITHCADPHAGGFTPSDFPEAGLSQDALDRFLRGLSR